MHLSSSPAFTRRFGKKVKALGGRYSHCRGDCSKRFVTLPTTPEGALLADEIVRVHPSFSRSRGRRGTTVIARRCTPRAPQAWVDVHYFDHRKVSTNVVEWLGVQVNAMMAQWESRFGTKKAV